MTDPIQTAGSTAEGATIAQRINDLVIAIMRAMEILFRGMA